MTTEQIAKRLEKRKITVISNASKLLPDYYPKSIYTVKQVKQYLPASKKDGRAKALLQFFDQRTGGLRTVCASDIIKVNK